jgi:hypothetical protein
MTALSWQPPLPPPVTSCKNCPENEGSAWGFCMATDAPLEDKNMAIFAQNKNGLTATCPMWQQQNKIVDCQCESCKPNTLIDQRMIVCSICGNKRCPHATNHIHACTNSNEVGQAGSSWEHVKQISERTS